MSDQGTEHTCFYGNGQKCPACDLARATPFVWQGRTVKIVGYDLCMSRVDAPTDWDYTQPDAKAAVAMTVDEGVWTAGPNENGTLGISSRAGRYYELSGPTDMVCQFQLGVYNPGDPEYQPVPRPTATNTD